MTTNVGGTGIYSNVIQGGRLQVRVIVELGNDVDTVDKLATLETFLKEGNTVGFAFDHDLTWSFARPSSFPSRGDTSIQLVDNVTEQWNTSSAPAADQRIVIQSPLLELKREYNQISTFTLLGRTATLVNPIVRSFNTGPVIVRPKYFYPALMLAPNQRTSSILTSQNGFDWTFDVTFWEDLGTLSGWDQLDLGGSTEGAAGKPFSDYDPFNDSTAQPFGSTSTSIKK